MKPHTSIHRRLFGLAKDVRGFLPTLALLSFLTAIIVILQMYLLSKIINEVFILSKAPSNNLLIMMAVSIAIRALLIWLRERFAQQKAIQIKSALRLNVFDHLLHLGPVVNRITKTGELVATITDGAEKLDDYYTKYIPSVVHIAILPITIVLFSLYTDWLSGLIMLLTAPLILFFMWLIGTWAKNLTQKQWKKLTEMSSHFLDALQGLKTLKIFNMNRKEAESVGEVSNNFRIITMKVLQVAFLSGMVLELAASISIAMVALQVGIRLIEGMMPCQTGLFILLLTPEFYLPFRTLGQHHHTGMESASAAETMFSLLNTGSDPKKISAGQKFPEGSLTIEFTGVEYTYPKALHPALQQIQCSLEPGKLTALVGHTGSGKTTFSFLMMGYIQPSSGQISFNGVPVEQVDEDFLIGLIAYVPQHPHFFNTSVVNNLKMANPQASDDEVYQACINAGAHHFIEQLPQGYDTMLAENASRLSGGEKQRLAIARAFLKNAPLLVLDEPTSNLDPESEEYIAKATEKLVKDRTTLIIAHRLKTVYRADNIIVLDQGRIAESGNHESLNAQDGIYASYMRTMGNGKGGMP